MGFKEIISKLGEKSKERKEKIRLLDEQIRLQKLVEDRMKSANEREWERFQEEDREENIKKSLEILRRKRRDDIAFNHNPLNTKNIMKSDWEVLKERNMFKKTKSTLFDGDGSVMKNNSNLLRNNMRLLK